jgi:hypothetical protein
MFTRGQQVRTKRPKQYVIPCRGRLGRQLWLKEGSIVTVRCSHKGTTTVCGFYGGGTIDFKDSDLEEIVGQ